MWTDEGSFRVGLHHLCTSDETKEVIPLTDVLVQSVIKHTPNLLKV